MRRPFRIEMLEHGQGIPLGVLARADGGVTNRRSRRADPDFLKMAIGDALLLALRPVSTRVLPTHLLPAVLLFLADGQHTRREIEIIDL